MIVSYLGQIIAVSFKMVPEDWRLCDGSLVSISEFQSLFNLLGTTYGGDGIEKFALPDLRGRLVVSQGQGPGRSDYDLGQAGGVENVNLNLAQIQPHTHPLTAVDLPGRPTIQPDPLKPPFPPGPSGTYLLAQNTQFSFNMYSPGPPNVTLAPSSIDPYQGQSIPHENRQPFQVINYIICVNGVYPHQ
jgi:microcystin-dependent protein